MVNLFNGQYGLIQKLYKIMVNLVMGLEQSSEQLLHCLWLFRIRDGHKLAHETKFVMNSVGSCL